MIMPTWAAADDRACTILLVALPNDLMRRFQAREMRAHLISSELQSMFECRDISSVGVLFQEYFSITLATCDGAVDYVGRMQEVADRLAARQAALPEALQIHRLLFNLTPEYESRLHAFTEANPFASLHEVAQWIIDTEVKLRTPIVNLTTPQSSSFSLNATQQRGGRNGSRGGRGGGGGGGGRGRGGGGGSGGGRGGRGGGGSSGACGTLAGGPSGTGAAAAATGAAATAAATGAAAAAAAAAATAAAGAAAAAAAGAAAAAAAGAAAAAAAGAAAAAAAGAAAAAVAGAAAGAAAAAAALSAAATTRNLSLLPFSPSLHAHPFPGSYPWDPSSSSSLPSAP
ncbi:unnamed protein product [Closterium sp. NIES-64]|nr:unnamed protein product [Closterium sp. NIES-64]